MAHTENHPSLGKLANLISQFEENISSSSVSQHQNFSSLASSPKVLDTPTIQPSTTVTYSHNSANVCHAQIHSEPKLEEGEVFCSLSVANRIKMLDSLNECSNNHDKRNSVNFTEQTPGCDKTIGNGKVANGNGKVAAIVREIEHQNELVDNGGLSNATNSHSPRLDLSAIKYFRRPSVPETFEDIQYLRALVNSQSNVLSCSTERLDRIELNFEKVHKYLTMHIEIMIFL